MNAIKLAKQNINPERLTQELWNAPGTEAVDGLSWDDDEVRIHIRGKITGAVREAVNAVIDAHDPAALTPAQQKQAALRAARAAHRNPIDPDRATVRELAQRLHWLEQEIRARLMDERAG